ncbi:hypothetical protein K8T06_10800 [bacterium]|nr:hypothetical protein [bacterium]
MRENIVELEKVRDNLAKLPPGKISELSEYVDFLLSKTSRSKALKIKKLEGIWVGLGFEKLDVEKEISNLRTEIENELLGS